MTGVAGFVAPRHLKAIQDTGNRLVAAVDPHDAVGVLDRYSFDVRFFTEIERFDRHLEKLRRGPEAERVALRQHLLAELPARRAHPARAARRRATRSARSRSSSIRGTSTRSQELERETGRRVNTVLQLRLHPQLIALRERLRADAASRRHDVSPDLHHGARPLVRRVVEGLARSAPAASSPTSAFISSTCCCGCSAPVQACEVHLREPRRIGRRPRARARARALVPVDRRRAICRSRRSPARKTTFRSITVDGDEVEFSEGFTDLHTRVYEEVLAGRGFGIDDARPSIELSHRIRQTPVTPTARRAASACWQAR